MAARLRRPVSGRRTPKENLLRFPPVGGVVSLRETFLPPLGGEKFSPPLGGKNLFFPPFEGEKI